ncbi:hypothetical protein RRG08_038244 [Elysia crispata]|uniref:Uncharacterized protein n=1 Tax=Elysia crispata TaxID=231223 RepID=A0AAE1E2T1_9GAST|nr:hypothetical protein RRG08_038244 [Elysia crispata]
MSSRSGRSEGKRLGVFTRRPPLRLAPPLAAEERRAQPIGTGLGLTPYLQALPSGVDVSDTRRPSRFSPAAPSPIPGFLASARQAWFGYSPSSFFHPNRNHWCPINSLPLTLRQKHQA